MVVNDLQFRRRNIRIVSEAQNALNIAFGAILSAYIGNSLTEIDDHRFDHVAMAQFFVFLAAFILGLCMGNSMLMRGEYRFGLLFLAIGGAGAVLAHHVGRTIGFEVAVLRILAICWVVVLLGSNAMLTLINYIHHWKTK
jgi:uncharacterized membrane protein YiaA